MTGTAETEAAEFARPTSSGRADPDQQADDPRSTSPTWSTRPRRPKFNAVVDDIVERTSRPAGPRRHRLGREVRAALARLLERRGIPHEVLNAKQHFREAAIVAQAGRKGAVTVATNMAGRGVDIMLGGNPSLAAREALGRGLAPGIRGYDEAYQRGSPSSRPICEAEGDEVRAGGLYVLGTERHESRRIDNQLRGRSGRQGDPGESRFYLSLEDDLMRLFATGAVSWVMDRTCPTTSRSRPRWSPRRSSGPRTRSRPATPRSARTSSSTTR
jgi:preprotein translocase subunit SecA